VDVSYVQVKESDFDEAFVNALAEQKGPDVVMISQDKLLMHRNKLQPIPYTVISERGYLDTFVDEVSLFMFPEGSYGMPVFVDPIVMYWNKTLFENAGLAKVPTDWETFKSNYVIPLTEKTSALEINQSAVAFGEYDNVVHAKELISLLSMQAGTKIINKDANGRIKSEFSDQLGATIAPAIAALNFYTEFSDPQKILYSWNRALPDSQNYFLSRDLAMYFGFASEYRVLQEKNPNISFDIAMVPQPKQTNDKKTYGRMYAFAIPKQSQYTSTDLEAIRALTSAVSVQKFADLLGVAPARRDVVSLGQADAVKSVVYNSAIISEAWLDPEPDVTNGIFRNMVRSVTSGTARTTEAVTKAGLELSNLVR
jgi:ABC-type glycerol-3-phosphate transport system substrate-binding protein